MFVLFKNCLHWLLTLLFRVEVHGIENYHNAGKRVLIVANHLSFLDPLLLGVFLPDKITFAINTHIAQQWWLRPFLGLSQVFPVDPIHPLSLKALVTHLKTDTKVVIFPEGRISVTGALMKIYDGTGMIADKSEAIILPLRIEGTQYTHFSKLHNKMRLRWFPKITLTILPPTTIHLEDNLQGKARRKSAGQRLDDIMTEMMFTGIRFPANLFEAVLKARAIHGGSHLIMEDLERVPLSYNQFISRVFILAKALKTISSDGEYIGVLLPNSCKTVCVILGLQVAERVPAMLNYSSGANGMLAACRVAQIKTVLTSRRFIELAQLTAVAESLTQHLNLIYLEDIAAKITLVDKLRGLKQSMTADFCYKPKLNPAEKAVILFTSGSEGEPKGVVLSQQNILANVAQVATRVSFTAQDKVLNFLPMFHSFGFTIGTMLPLINGLKTFFYPSPLHYAVIPEMIYEMNATVIFGTNTFFAAYAKKAHPYDFYSLRYVIAGAEKLQQSTRELWAEKFGIRILEGYGATETSPVVAVNTPIDYRLGSVGRFMPAMRYQLEPVEGIETGGKLHVAGPNIMLGYLLANNPGVLVPPISQYGVGWYDTGDIVEVDEDGFILIKGRSKRFAKIGGEMISLTAVEQLASKVWPAGFHAVVSLADAKKGEQIILMTTQANASLAELIATGTASIGLPRKIIVVDAIPVLGTGKINYPQVTELAMQHLG